MDISAPGWAGLMCRSSWSIYNGLYSFLCVLLFDYSFASPPAFLGVILFCPSFFPSCHMWSMCMDLQCVCVCVCSSICPCKYTHTHMICTLMETSGAFPYHPLHYYRQNLSLIQTWTASTVWQWGLGSIWLLPAWGLQTHVTMPSFTGVQGICTWAFMLEGSYWLSHWPKPLQSNHHSRNFWNK